MLAEDPVGRAQAERLHPGEEPVQAAGVADPLLEESHLRGADAHADRLTGHLAGPLHIGPVQARRVRRAGAPGLTAAPGDPDERPAADKAHGADRPLERGIAGPGPAERGGFENISRAARGFLHLCLTLS